MIWVYHLGYALDGGLFALCALLVWRDGQRIRGEQYFKDLHGELVDFTKIAKHSSFFLSRVVELEHLRLRRLANANAEQLLQRQWEIVQASRIDEEQNR